MRQRVLVVVLLGAASATHAQAAPEGLGEQDVEPAAPVTEVATPPASTPTQREAAAKEAEAKNAEAEADAKKAAEKAKETAAVVANASKGPSRPQLIAVRGGSLGLAVAAETEGVQAGLDAKLAGDSSADAFAKVGTVFLSSQLAVDVIGETYQADLPRVVLTGLPTQPKIATTKMASVGLRVRYNLGTVLWATRTLTDECLATLRPQQASRIRLQEQIDTEKKKAITDAPTDAANPHRTTAVRKQTVDVSDATKITQNACAPAELADLTTATTWSFTAGLRLARRGGSEEAFSNIQAFTWELAARRDSERRTLAHTEFFGLSGSHLNSSDDVADSMTTRFLRTNEVRLSAGVELRASAKSNITVTPAVGLYGVISHNYWTNELHAGLPEKIRGWQVEGGLYVSGVMTGFSGLLEFSILRPYGHDDEYQGIISVIPFGGGVAASAEAK